MSSVPGVSGQNILYAVLCGGATVAGLSYVSCVVFFKIVGSSFHLHDATTILTWALISMPQRTVQQYNKMSQFCQMTHCATCPGFKSFNFGKWKWSAYDFFLPFSSDRPTALWARTATGSTIASQNSTRGPGSTGYLDPGPLRVSVPHLFSTRLH